MSDLTPIVPFRTSSGKWVVPRRFLKKENRPTPISPQKPAQPYANRTQKPTQHHSSNCQPIQIVGIILKNETYDDKNGFGWGIGGIEDAKVLYTRRFDSSTEGLVSPQNSFDDALEVSGNFAFTPEQEVVSSPSGYDSS